MTATAGGFRHLGEEQLAMSLELHHSSEIAMARNRALVSPTVDLGSCSAGGADAMSVTTGARGLAMHLDATMGRGGHGEGDDGEEEVADDLHGGWLAWPGIVTVVGDGDQNAPKNPIGEARLTLWQSGTIGSSLLFRRDRTLDICAAWPEATVLERRAMYTSHV